MNDKTLLFCLPAILCAPLFGAHASGKETPKDDGERTGRPNVLFLLTDDQTFNTIRALGNTEIHTPNMDRLVRRGVAFTQTHVMGGLNGAVSQPSRAMLLTGRGLMDVHRNGGFIPEAEKTFPEVFRENGYTTFATGKWHSDNASFNRSFSTGANIFFGGMHPYGRNNELGHRRPYLHQYDLYPTLCGLAGIGVPATVKGISLEETLRNPEAGKREDILLTYINLQRAIKKDGFKLILYNVDGQRHPQLFDLKADPMELKNLYDDPAYREKREELTALLYARMKAAGDFCDPAKPDWGYPGKLDWKQVVQVNP